MRSRPCQPARLQPRPSPTVLNQALAFGLCGAFVGLCRPLRPGRGLLLWAALALLMAAAL